MLGLLLIGWQVSGVPGVAGAPSSTPLDFHVVQRCPAGNPDGDVVVCGTRDPDRYRLKPPPAAFAREEKLAKAEVPIGGGKLAATTQQVTIGGVPSNRVMVSLKLPF